MAIAVGDLETSEEARPTFGFVGDREPFSCDGQVKK